MTENFNKAKKELIEISRKMSATDISKRELKELKKKKKKVLRTLIAIDKARAIVNIEQTKIEQYRRDLSHKKRDLAFLLLCISFPITIIICVLFALLIPSLAPALSIIILIIFAVSAFITRIGVAINHHNRVKAMRKRIDSYYDESP